MQGVYKYDGSHFSHYASGAEVTGGMIGNNVQSDFYEDENSNIWWPRIFGITIN